MAMTLRDIENLLPQLLPGLPPGFHPLILPQDIWEELVTNPATLSFLEWLDTTDVERNDLRVLVSSSGEMKIASPGIWQQDDHPVVLFGFAGSKPVTAPLDGLSLVRSHNNLYTASFNDGPDFEIRFRLQTEAEIDTLPTILTPAKACALAKNLPTGGGSGSEDWKKFRDVVSEGETLDLVVYKLEVKKLSKDGKTFSLNLAYSDHGVFLLSDKHYQFIESLSLWNNHKGNGTEAKVRVKQDGFYSGHKVYKLSAI